MEYGVQLYSLRDYIEQNGLERALRAVSEAGFTGVEFAGFYGKSGEEISELLSRYRLTAISAHVAADNMREQLPVLKALGIECAIIPYLPFNNGLSFEEGLETCRKAESFLKGCGLALGYHNHAHEFLNGTDVVGRLSEGLPEMKLELDVFWLAVAGVDALGYMRAHRDKLLYLHIKELGECAEGVNPVLGDGNAHIAEVIALGKKFDLDWSVLEVEKTDIPMEEYLRRCYEFIEKCK